jgi:uncharacterized protein YbjT (DUF2867 family)
MDAALVRLLETRPGPHLSRRTLGRDVGSRGGMRVLVVGAYGLIGGYVAARLLRDGHEVIGCGRDVAVAARRMPRLRWVRIDLAAANADAWRTELAGVEAVVNCAGALQDGPRDSLKAVHLDGVLTLAKVCVAAGVRRFVQISAAGVERGRGAFSHTKLAGDQALAALDLDWVVLRPGLVLAPAAFGGSALLRGLAAFPGFIPAVHADAVVQVVSVEDLAEAVARAVKPGAPAQVICDLAAAEPMRLAEVLAALRGWLGLAPAAVVSLPAPLGRIAAAAADGLAWLGWRSPLRSASLAQLTAGVRADPAEAERRLGLAPRGLAEILEQWPSGVQERWFARLYFVKPLVLATLAAFWCVSGVIGLLHRDEAARILIGIGAPSAQLLVMGGGVIDLLLGALVCARRTAPFALWGMILVTACYLAGASLWRPELWADPLGPLVKTLPAAVLALAALGMMDER